MVGRTSGKLTVRFGPNRCRVVVVSPCTSSGKYILPARPSLGSFIQVMFGSSAFIRSAIPWLSKFAADGGRRKQVQSRPIVRSWRSQHAGDRPDDDGQDPHAQSHQQIALTQGVVNLSPI